MVSSIKKCWREFKNKLFESIGIIFGVEIEISLRNWYSNKSGSTIDRYDRWILRRNGKKDKFYVLRYNAKLMGFAAVMRDILFVDSWANKNKFKIIIDFEPEVLLFYDNNTSINNIWEFFFQQEPLLKDVLSDNGNTVVFSPINSRGVYDKPFNKKLTGSRTDTNFHFISGENGKYYRDTLRKISQKYFCFKKSIVIDFDNKYELLCKKGLSRNSVAVLMREEFSPEHLDTVTDEEHRNVLAYHPILPSVNEIIEMVSDYVKEWNVDSIFVATMYNETIRKFMDSFGERMVFFADRKRLDTYKLDSIDVLNKGVPFGKFVQPGTDIDMDGLYEKDMAYMFELYSMSRSNYFISPKCGGGFIVPLLRDSEFNDIVYLENKNRNCRYV